MLVSIRCEFCRLIDASVCRFTALTSVSSCCSGVSLDVVGRGYMPRKFDDDILAPGDDDILAPGNAVARGAEVLVGEMLAVYIRRHFQSFGI